ncbi:hypothetical protein KVR01_007799 [Diaporthe batatas]|uniref:uncharacterized protein n=1 Tax=Diaporthe batatas TaxID=748121 RepID=UPI001D04BEC7|nr:uncharacterized protein KVR01_007799 [Diaporthe batatas]KAG8162034.1 hypothetical protein KVR01_007799 [Diaporthe batatas]
MFKRLLKKEEKHDDDMTVWVPKGVYNSVAPIWDERYAWHPMAVDDSLPMDQTSFIQVDNKVEDGEENPESHNETAASSSNENSAPEASADDSASVHSAVSTVPSMTGRSRQGYSAQQPGKLQKRTSFGFPVRQMSWNTSRRKREALLQRNKSRNKCGVPGKRTSSQAPAAPVAGKGSPGPGTGPRSSASVPVSVGGDFVMYAL